MQSQIKWIGLLLIVASCSGLGIRLAHLYGHRIRQCRQVEQGLQRLLGEIRFHQVPLEEALRETGQALGNVEFANFLLKVADRLAGKSGSRAAETGDDNDRIRSETAEATLGQVWQQEWEWYMETSLLQEEQELLLTLGKQLGTLDLEAQVRSLQQCLDQWNRHMEVLQRKEESYGRLCRGMGISVGAFLAILLL